MATMVLVIDTSSTIQQLTSDLSPSFKERQATMSQVINFLGRVDMAETGSIQVTVRDTDPAVTTSGSGSFQYTV